MESLSIALASQISSITSSSYEYDQNAELTDTDEVMVYAAVSILYAAMVAILCLLLLVANAINLVVEVVGDNFEPVKEGASALMQPLRGMFDKRNDYMDKMDVPMDASEAYWFAQSSEHEEKV